MGQALVDIELTVRDSEGTKTVEKTNIFGKKYWDVETVKTHGYSIWCDDEVIHEACGFADEDEAYDSAVEYLDSRFGDTGWIC